MKTRLLFVGLLSLLLAAASVPLYAQDATPQVEISDASLARYTDGGQMQLVVEFQNSGEVDPGAISVTEDGKPISEIAVEQISESTISNAIILVIDTSGSMEGPGLAAAKEAAIALINGKRSKDYMAIVSFSDGPVVRTGLTNSKSELRNAVEALQTSGGTALYDAVMKGVEIYESVTNDLVKNVIVLSDGNDADSKATLAEAAKAVGDSQVRVFTVALEGEDFDPASLAQIAQAGGGLALTTPNPEELAGLYKQIQTEIDNSYVIRFTGLQTKRAEVTYQVAYQGLTASFTVEVPGFTPVTTTRPAPTTTRPTITIPAGSPLPASPLVLRAIGSGAAAIAAALFLFILFGGKRDDAAATLGKRLAAYGRRGARGEGEGEQRLIERIPLLRLFAARAEEEVKKRGLLSGVNAILDQANIPLSAGEAVAASLGLSALVGVITGLVTVNTIIGIVAFAVMLVIVASIIQYAGAREKRRFESQLPDTLTLLSTSLRAGYSLLQAVEAVAAEAPEPTSREFGRAIAESRLGRPVVAALQGITDRMRSGDFDWAVMAIEIQREVGGNLAEVLQTVADTMLARNRLKGEIRALTAEGRISAIVLIMLPIGLGFFVWSSNPDYISPLFTDVRGVVAIVVGGLLMVAGWFWLRKIVNIEV